MKAAGDRLEVWSLGGPSVPAPRLALVPAPVTFLQML